MKNMRLLLFIISLLVSCGSVKTNASESLLDKIILTSPEIIRTKVGSTVQLTLDIPVGFDGTFSWSINNKVFATNQNTSITFNQPGVGRIIATATTHSGVSKSFTTHFFAAKNNKFQVLVYQPSWRGYQNQNWDKITHMCMCFGSVSADGSINTTEMKNTLTQAITHAHENGVYALLSIGGGDADLEGAYGFTEALRHSPTRKSLVENVVKAIKELDMDGVDVDYEHWDYAMGADNKVRSANLELFYRDLRAALPSGYLQTTAIGIFPINNKYFTDTMHQYLDLVNLMIYDATGPWASSSVGPHSAWDFYLDTIAAARRAHIPDVKIIAGVPFYGVKFQSPTSSAGAQHMTYDQIVKGYADAENKNEIEGQHIYYDGKPMIEKKTKYVLSENLGGMMVWELTQDSDDEAKSLLRVIDSVLGEAK